MSLAEAYRGVTALLDSLPDDDLRRPTRCAGWTVADVAVHLLADAHRALVACATPTDAAPSVDSPRYWTAWAEAADPDEDERTARFVRVHASAYRPEGLRAEWRETSEAAVRAVAARDPAERVATQGEVLTVRDLERTLVVEAVVHHLDCLLDLPDRPHPAPAALQVALEDLAALAGTPLPPGDDAGWVLRAAGRLPLDDGHRAALGTAADRFPLL